MTNLLGSDLYRLSKGKLFYGILIFTGVVAFLLTMLIRQDIRIGISVFGDLTAFRNANDIIRIGTQYYKGLGILIAIIISVFIGQEYQWSTWQNKWITSKSRIGIYLSKVFISSAISVAVFLTFVIIVFFASNQMQELTSTGYISKIICGVFIYATLGTNLCLLSMAIKSITSGAIVCLCYVMFSETLVNLMQNIGGLFPTASNLIAWIVRHSTYGMSTVVSATSISTSLALNIVINSAVLMLFSTVIGIFLFRKYEL